MSAEFLEINIKFQRMDEGVIKDSKHFQDSLCFCKSSLYHAEGEEENEAARDNWKDVGQDTGIR